MALTKIRPFKETGQHSYHRRAIGHDYHAPFIYHIIFKKAEGCEPFGSLGGDARIAPGEPGCAQIVESVLGTVIAKGVVHLPYEYPIIKICKFCVMPDHVHVLLQVRWRSEMHLDDYMDALTELIARRYSAKMAVKIRRVFTPEERLRKKEAWLSAAARGTVLVSPFISPDEKQVRAEAEALGARVILIVHEAFGERYKPAAHDFELCSSGHLLIISLGLPLGTPLTRYLCERMNQLAFTLAEGSGEAVKE